MVYVISIEGKPLMPTVRHGKVRRMLRDKKACVVRTTPFTIKLLYLPKTNVVQKLVLGIDPGSSTFATAVRVENNTKIVYASEVTVRNDISKKLKRRSHYRRNRRNRKTRYRQPRFLNRKRKERWLPPTLVSKIQSHVKEVKHVFSILPISRIVLEKNTFDIHKLKDPTVEGKNYQQGTLYNYENHRQYVLSRDLHSCKSCKKKNIPLQTHHVIYKSNEGRDHYTNLITLCDVCHKKIHAGKLKLSKKLLNTIGTTVNTKHATHATIISKRLEEFLEKHKVKKNYKFHITFGYETVMKRRLLHLKKTHYNDAVSISYPKKKSFKKVEIFNFYRKLSVSKGDYQQTKGVRSHQKIPTGKIKGFRKFDVVKYKGKRYIIKGRMSSGYAILMNSKEEKVNLKPVPKFKLLRRISARTSTITLKIRKKRGKRVRLHPLP